MAAGLLEISSPWMEAIKQYDSKTLAFEVLKSAAESQPSWLLDSL